MKIAIDAMGGDKGLSVVIPAVKQVLDNDKDGLQIVLVGIESEINDMLIKYKVKSPQLSVVHASEFITMDESPALALRYKKDSSIRVAANLLKANKADALVSSGNTGALMAISKFVLKTIPGVTRPAIISAIPTIKGHTYLLDLGANIDCSAENLYQFAIMGAILKSSLSNGEIKPKVALLNIGEEELKGTESIREASKLLSKNKYINYIGYIEGSDIYCDVADVIVCDGFVGNVALKTSEGLSQFISDIFKKAYTKSWYTKLLGLLTMPIVNSIREQLDPKNYNGASLIGLNNIVIKSHGSADVKAFTQAIMRAKEAIDHNLITHLKDKAWMLDHNQ